MEIIFSRRVLLYVSSTLFFLILLIAAIILESCNKDNNPASSESDLNGIWAGVTSDGLGIIFRVSNNTVDSLAISYRIENCQVSSTHCTKVSPVTISENTFTVTAIDSALNTISFELKGNFTSGNSASGSLGVAFVRPPFVLCIDSVTWTATKQSGTNINPVNLIGTWTGTSSSNLVPINYITLVISQIGNNLNGTFTSTSGSEGFINGTISSNNINFTFTQTTPTCPGSFTGTATVNGDTMDFTYTGSDCLGPHTNGLGKVVKNAVLPPQSENLYFKISLANLPQTLNFNQSHVPLHSAEYWWGIQFNTDNNNSTGAQGFDIEIALVHAKLDSNSFQDSPIEGTDRQVIEWTDTLGQIRGKVRHNSVSAWIDPGNPNTIIISAPLSWTEISRIKENTPFNIHTFYLAPNPPNGIDQTSTTTGSQIITDPEGDANYDFVDIISGGWSNNPLLKLTKSKMKQPEIKNNIIEKLSWKEGSWIYK